MKETAKPLNREAVKYIAMFTMLLNHIGNIFLPAGGFLTEVLLAVGYFTAVTMLYFLAEGFFYTHSKKAYLKRLLLFAVLSELPFCLAFTKEGLLEFVGFNMMFSLFLSFLLLCIQRERSRAKRLIVTVSVFVLASFSDWNILAPVYALLFYHAHGSYEKQKQAYTEALLFFGIFCLLNRFGILPFWKVLLFSAMDVLGMSLSALVVLKLYNGRQLPKGSASSRFSKWFFYLFYPVHLLILGLLRIL